MKQFTIEQLASAIGRTGSMYNYLSTNDSILYILKYCKSSNSVELFKDIGCENFAICLLQSSQLTTVELKILDEEIINEFLSYKDTLTTLIIKYHENNNNTTKETTS